MAVNVTLQDVATLQNSSIVAATNANNTIIETALEDCLSLSGGVPNQMQANLDMNGQQIINLPAPGTLNSPLRLIDGVTAANINSGGLTIPTLTGNNNFTGTNTFVTQPPGTNNTTAATTAFVHAATAAFAQTSGLTNINTLLSSPLVADGLTSNVTQLQSLTSALQSVSPEMPVPVNVTIGNPTILSINPTIPSGGTYPNPAIHFLKPNQSFYFIQTSAGTIPTGISLNTPYYITSANLTPTTFTFSTTNNYSRLASTVEGSTVPTSGSLTATLSIVLTGRDVNLFIPPGAYFGGNYGDSVPTVYLTPNGMTRVRYFGYGAMFDIKTNFGTPLSALGGYATAPDWDFTAFDYINTPVYSTSQSPGFNQQITLVTTAHISRYFVNQWVCVMGLNIQDTYNASAGGNSGPPNAQYQEYKRIIAVDAGTGTLTLDGPLKYVYLSTFPKMIVPNSVFVMSGAAAIVPMHPSWDAEVELHGIRYIGQTGATMARRVLYKDCVFQGFGDYPSQIAMACAQSYIYRNCRFGPSMTQLSTYMEVDKMMEYFELDGCSAYNKYQILFQSPSFQVGNIKNHQGATINGTPRDLKITDSVLDGINVGPYISVSDSLEIQNTRSLTFDLLNRNDDNVSGFVSNITPSSDMTLVPNWTFASGVFTRNLTGLPGLQSMNWQVPGAKFYMVDAGNTYRYYQNMGSPFTILNVYMDGSGNFSFETTLSAVPTRQASHTVTFTPTTTINWAANGLSNGTAVCFTTTGTFPTGLSNSTIYYVVSAAANTFSVSLTVGGAAVTFTGSGTGTTTVYTNPLCFRPHPCARFTGIGNSGCAALLDLNGAVDEPLFSRVKRSFVGKQNLPGGGTQSDYQAPLPRIWGNLISMTVNVIKAGSAGTLNISCPGFTQPNLGLSNFSQTVDTTVAGKRIVTNTAVSGSAGADSLAAYADWVAGPLIFTWAAAPATLTNSPIVTFEMLTDQGITRFGNMMGAPGTPASNSELWMWNDSSIIQQYGSLP